MALTAEEQALDFNPELQDVGRQRKLAELLMAQGMQQPQGQMISGRYVAPSWTQMLNPMANILAGQAVGERADTKQNEMAMALRVQGDKAAQEVMKAYKQDPQLALAKASQYQQYPQVKALLPQLSKVALPEATTLEREFIAAKNQGYQGNINDFKNQMSKYQESQAADAQKRLAFESQRIGLEGGRLGLDQQRFGLEQQKFAQEFENGKPLTEAQGNATAFGMRAKQSNALLNQLEQSGTKNTGVVRSAVASTLGMTPFIGEKLEQGVSNAMNVLPSAMGGPNAAQQATDQARRNFVTAILRKESGAAISPSEFANEAQKYFPQPGDADSVIKQKQQARELAIKALEIQAGPGAKQIKAMGTDTGVVDFNSLPKRGQ
jgi:hypothetical protein